MISRPERVIDRIDHDADQPAACIGNRLRNRGGQSQPPILHQVALEKQLGLHRSADLLKEALVPREISFLGSFRRHGQLTAQQGTPGDFRDGRNCGQNWTRATPAGRRYAYVSQESIGSDPGAIDVVDLATRKVASSIAIPAQPTGVTILKL